MSAIYQAVIGTVTLGGLGFLCLHQTPKESRYKTYLHKLQHDYSSVSGFGTRSGFEIKRGSQTHIINGFICGDCGHVSHPDFREKSDETNQVWLDRVDGDVWMTDKVFPLTPKPLPICCPKGCDWNGNLRL